MPDSIKSILADKITPAVNSPQWYFFVILAVALAAFLGWKWLDTKRNSSPKEDTSYAGPERRASAGEAITCVRHSERLSVIEGNIAELHEKINSQAVSTKEAIHQNFRELLDELRQENEIRDKAIEKLLDSKLATFREFTMNQLICTSRTLIMSIVDERLKHKEKEKQA